MSCALSTVTATRTRTARLAAATTALATARVSGVHNVGRRLNRLDERVILHLAPFLCLLMLGSKPEYRSTYLRTILRFGINLLSICLFVKLKVAYYMTRDIINYF